MDFIYSFILTLFFLFFAVILFFVGKKGLKVGNRHGASSTIACSIMFFFFAVYNAYFKLFIYPFNGFMVWWLGIVGSVNIIFIAIIKREVKIIREAQRENSHPEGKWKEKQADKSP